MAFPQTRLPIKVEIAPGADLTASPALWTWVDVSAYVRTRDLIAIARGGLNEFDTMRPASCALVVDNTGGRFVARNPTGTWYPDLRRGTPLRVQVDAGSGYTPRFTGEISSLPTRWDVSGRNKYVPIAASGVLRRLNQGAVLRSAMYRAHAIQAYASKPEAKAYWPGEDAAGATSLASAVGGPAMVFSALTPAANTTMVGSDPVPVFGPIPTIGGTVPTFTSTGAWTIRFLLYIPAPIASAVFPMGWYTPGGGGPDTWRLIITPGAPDTVKMEAFIGGVEVLADPGGLFTEHTGTTELYGEQLYVRVDVAQNGANLDWSYRYTRADNDGVGQAGTLAAATVRNPSWLQTAFSGGLNGSTIAHVAVSDSANYGPIFDSQAAGAYDGEDAGVRFGRLCAEEDVQADYIVLPGIFGEAMGEQQRGKFVDLLGHVRDADGGLLYEKTDGTLFYRQRMARYNRTVAMTLNYAAQQVAPPFEPTDDDLSTRNDVEVSRFGGSKARYASIKAGFTPSAIGTYDDSVTLNVQYDAVLPYHAQWRVHLGTAEDQRYPQVSLNFARAPSLITTWVACDIGSRIQVSNPPPELPPDTIDLELTGYTELLGPFTWQVSANCAPYRPWEVFKIEDSRLGRIDTAGSTLVAAVTSTATSIKVSTDTSLGPPWATTGTPWDIEIAGERLTVTAVSNAAVTFIAAGTAAHASNASLSPALPAGLLGGHAMFLLAAIRNSGTGTVNTPTGWTHLFEADSMALFGKIAAGTIGSASTESVPSVTFTGGVANATTSAQICAFANCSIDSIRSVTQANGSAQNIAYPLLGTDRPNTLMLTLGWKQDDWTSVATLAGQTEIGEPSSILGDDQGLVWDYVIQTAAAEQAAGSFVVTGGAAAISRGAVVAIAGDVQTMTVTRSVNTVVKAQAEGAVVKLWRPGVTAL